LAAVGYEQIPDASYRNCYDFKMREDQVESVQEKVGEIYKTTTGQIRACVENYSRDYKINMGFMEAVNFVKYSTGEHFSYHSDHAYHYVCTVSTVAYFNDDYEGGELHFDKFDLKVKPREGQIIVFPSTFLYSHASLPVTSGTKFAAVTMFDYNNEYSEFRKTLLSKH
jgi:predicted 2-oxoglutarate/Fe(II)-dependent dioxygenase YbiX